MSSLKIGFIGLGVMGRVIAGHLLKAGYPLSVYNRTRESTAEFAAAGCAVAAAPGELAGRSDVIIAMVSDEIAMSEVLDGPGGVLTGGFSGKTLVSMSTLPVPYVKALAERCAREGISFLDCPVSGSKPLAETRQLVFLAGGEEDLAAKLKPLLLAAGKAVVYAGRAPGGTALKLCVNLILAQMTSALGESVALARILHLDPAAIFETMEESPAFNCGFFRLKREGALAAKPGSAPLFRNMLKDVRYMLDESRKGEQSLPVLEALGKVLESAAGITRGRGFQQERKADGKERD